MMIIYETNQADTPNNWDNVTISEMAATMQDMDAVGEAVTPENLKLRGYDSADITRYGLRAASLARKLSVKRVM